MLWTLTFYSLKAKYPWYICNTIQGEHHVIVLFTHYFSLLYFHPVPFQPPGVTYVNLQVLLCCYTDSDPNIYHHRLYQPLTVYE